MKERKIRLIAFLAVPFFIYLAMEVFYILSNVEYARIPWIPGFIFCFIILMMFYIFLYGIFGSTYKSTIALSVFLFVLLLVDQIKIALSDDPVFISDVLFLNSTGTFMGILKDSLWGLIVRYLLLIIMLAVSLIWICRFSKQHEYKTRAAWKIRWSFLVAPVAFFVLIFLPVKAITTPIMVGFFNVNGRQDSYATTNMGYYFKFGFLSGIYGQYVENRMEEPDGYDSEALDKVLAAVNTSTEDTGGFGKPNIIMIFSESFWDIDCLTEVQFNQQAAPNFHKLQKEGKLVNMISPSYGGISANVEFEMLTSGSIKFFTKGYIPYMQLYREDKYSNSPSVIRELKKAGYRTHITSTWESSLFNCEKVYQYIDVDEVEYDRDLTDAEYKGGRISDEYVGKHIIEAFQQKEKGEKLFYMVLTAQAHMPFPEDKYDEYDIDIVDSKLSKDENDTIQSYAQGVYDADRQLGAVYDYIQTLDEPTILIFYGDHLPYLKTEDGDDVTKHLDYFNTEDELLNAYRRYNTQCLILSNYLEESDYLTEDTDYMGPDMIMPYILNKMDLQLSNYYRWLYTTRHDLPASNLYVTIDTKGNLYDTNQLEGKMKECFDTRKKMNWKQFVAVE